MINDFKDTRFKVEILLRNNQKGKTKICKGLKEVEDFTNAERIIVGKKNFVGYSSQAID